MLNKTDILLDGACHNISKILVQSAIEQNTSNVHVS